LKLIRQGQSKEVQVKIGTLPEEDEPVASAVEAPSKEFNRLGLSVTGLTAEQREQLEIKQFGVLVHDAKPGPALDAGIRRGDVILRIQDQPIKDVKQFNEVVKGLPKGKSIALLVQRHGGSQFLALKLKD
jgi:serine protease Do